MKMSKGVFLILLSLHSAQVAALAEEQVIKLQASGQRLPLALNIDTGGAISLLLQNSQDLQDWRPSVNVFAKARFFNFVDWSLAAPHASPRFYRAVAPAQSSDEMLSRWRSLGLSKYQYKFQWFCFCRLLSGIVTVHDGRVVAVTDARDAAGAPIPNPDLSQFKSIEDLFEIVQTESAVAALLTVVFDRGLNFPARIAIDYITQAVDDEITYQASDVQAIP